MKAALVGLGAGLMLFVLPLGLFVVLATAGLLQPEEEEPEAAGSTCRVTAAQGKEGPGRTRGVPEQWREEVEAAAEESGLPVEVLAAQIDHESSWEEDARNPSGAAGMAQFMPDTWAQYGEGDPMNGADAIRAMGKYMKALMGMTARESDDPTERIRMALAAYNWGDGNMASVDWDWKRGPSETTAYVAGILDAAQVEFKADCAPVVWDGDLGTGEWTHPLPGSALISGYGQRNVPGLPAWAQNHVGLDFATPTGGPVVAPTDMVVTALHLPDGCVLAKAKTTPKVGFALCHMGDIQVAEGDDLKRGTVLGQESNVAASVGGTPVDHLHFEMYRPDAGDPKFPGPGAPGVMDPTEILRAKVQ